MSKNGYTQYLVSKPVYQTSSGSRLKSPVMTYMSPELIPGCNKHIELRWISAMPEPGPSLEQAHDFDEIMLYIGNDFENPLDLGAEIEFGIDDQSASFDTTVSIYIPKGVKHGPTSWKKYSRPHLELSIMLGPASPRKTPSGTPANNLKGNINPEKYIVRKPAYLKNTKVTSAFKHAAMTYMNNDLVPNSNVYLDFGWVYTMPEPNPPIKEHIHDYEEMVLFIGRDHLHPEDLGSGVEFCVGGQPLSFNTTSALYLPKNLKHGPITWNNVDKPHILMPIIIGAANFAQAAPAGDSKG